MNVAANAEKVIIKAVETENPPMRFLLGAPALKNGLIKLNDLKKDFDAGEETTVGADFSKRVVCSYLIHL